MDFFKLKIFKLNYSLIIFLHASVLAVYVIASILFILNQDLFKGFSMDGLHNDFCLQEENKNDIICSNKFKKEKFIYVLIDGAAYDQLYELREKRDKYNITRIFRGITSDYKQSAVNHQIMFSGKKNRNFIGKTIKEDNLFFNFFKNGMKFTFRGIKLIIYTLVGHIYFERNKITPTEINSMDTMCDFALNVEDKWTKDFLEKISDDSGYFKQGYDKEYLYYKLDQHFEEDLKYFNQRGNDDEDFISNCFKNNFGWTGNQSIIYYGNKIDHINHNFHKQHVSVMAQIYVTEKILIRLLDWCYDHPDYAFFYATDHGGQEFFGEDNIVNHGGNEDGNEATFFAYTKDFADNYKKFKLKDKIVSIYDFSTLISQVIKDGVVPLESLGVPYPLANNNILKISAVKAKGQQLMKYIEIYDKKYPNNKNILLPINESVYEIYKKSDEDLVNNNEQYLNKLRELQNRMEEELSENNQNIFFLIIFYIIMIFLGLLIVYDVYILKTIVYKDNSPKNIFFYILTIFFGLFFPLFFVIFYPSNILYDKLYGSIINQYYSYSLLFLIFIILRFKKLNNANLIYYCSLTILLALLPLLSGLFYKYEIFLKMKRLFTSVKLAKICNFVFFYPVFAYYMYREIKKLKELYLDPNYKYSAFKIFSICGIFMFIFMVIFEIVIRPFFEVHTIISLITNHFVFLFGFIFLVSCFLEYYAKTDKYSKALGKTKIVDGFPILKLVLMLYHFYLSDEAERILLLFAFVPLLEFFSIKFLGQDKITKLLILICYLGSGELFYVITQRFFSFDISIKVLSRTVGMTGETFPLFSGILMGTHKLRYFFLLTGYLMSFSRFRRKEFFTNTSFMIRLVLYMQILGKILYFYYRYFHNLIGEEFLELFMWTMCHLIIYGIDGACIGIYELVKRLRIYYKNKKDKLVEEKAANSTNISVNVSVNNTVNTTVNSVTPVENIINKNV